jgi:hypothetical protein
MRLLPWKLRVAALVMMGSIVANGFAPMVQVEHLGSASLKQVPVDQVEHRIAPINFFACAAAALLIISSQPFPATAASVNSVDHSKFAQLLIRFNKETLKSVHSL